MARRAREHPAPRDVSAVARRLGLSFRDDGLLREQRRLVEAAPPQPPAVQRHRREHIRLGIAGREHARG